MSTPSLYPDDPRLTAYALGEANETDRQAVETYLADSAEGRAEVERTQAIARILASEYSCEHDLYVELRQEDKMPSNIVAFSSGRDRGWQLVTVLTLKIAAVAAIAASLVYLTQRRPHTPQVMTVASAPQGESGRKAAPRIANVDQFAKDKPLASPDQETSDSQDASAVGQTVATAPADPTGGNADASLAMESARDADDISETAARSSASSTFSKAEAAPSPFTRSDLKTAPAATSAAAVAPPPSAKPSSPETRVASAMIRIRTAAGEFFGGVLLSADGLVLAAPSVPESSLQQPCTVFLADQRERSAVATPAKIVSGWYWLFVDAKDLPAVPLANELPASDTPLTVASVDPRTGATTFSHFSTGDGDSSRRAARWQNDKSSTGSGDVNFAFNPAGELLVIDLTTQETQITEQAKSKRGSRASGRPPVRLFSDAERAELQQAAKKGSK